MRTKKMKVGIITEYFFPTIGGIVENIYHMSKELLRRGHDFRIVTGWRRGLPSLEKEITDRIIYIGRSVPTFFNGTCGYVSLGRNLTRRMREILTTEKFDIMHLHSPLFPTLPLIANAQANVPMVATYHTCTYTNMLYKLARRQLQSYLDRISGNIAVSECCALDNAKFFDAKFDVIANGVDVSWWTSDTRVIDKLNDGKVNVLFIGRPDFRNGLARLISAFSIVHRKCPNTRLVVVGDGPLRFYFERLVTEDIKGSVIFEGTATTARRDYMASSHILCFTPEIASFGITVIEGMSAGMPLVASDIEAFRQLLTNEESALLVDPTDTEALALAIVRLIVDDDLRERLGTTASMRVERYDWKRIAGQHIDYYNMILGVKLHGLTPVAS